jgi:hypothetical protein
MARIWSEPHDPCRHRNPMNSFGDAPPAAGAELRRRAPTLQSHPVVFVRVAGFTFEFHSREQLEAALGYYEQKIPGSSRVPAPRHRNAHDYFEPGQVQRWFERLPMFLREEPKRVEVVKALSRALSTYPTT